MVGTLKQVGTADWDRERFNVSVNKHFSQLVSACCENVARDVVWTGRLVRVNTFKCLAHIGQGEGEPTILGNGPCQWHCVILKAGEEGV